MKKENAGVIEHLLDINFLTVYFKKGSASFDLSEFATWVIDSIIENGSLDGCGKLNHNITFSDFWETQSITEQKEWVNEFVEIMESENELNIIYPPIKNAA